MNALGPWTEVRHSEREEVPKVAFVSARKCRVGTKVFINCPVATAVHRIPIRSPHATLTLDGAPPRQASHSGSRVCQVPLPLPILASCGRARAYMQLPRELMNLKSMSAQASLQYLNLKPWCCQYGILMPMDGKYHHNDTK